MSSLHLLCSGDKVVTLSTVLTFAFGMAQSRDLANKVRTINATLLTSNEWAGLLMTYLIIAQMYHKQEIIRCSLRRTREAIPEQTKYMQ